jgi:predicted AAA+ superfamily ATPase
VRRAGKTTLCRSLPNVEYLDCELPRVRNRLEDPEAFYRSLGGSPGRKRRIVLDEIQRLPDPSETLKIAADHFGDRIQVIGTGSSTLGASRKFRDTLTGRKHALWLTPMVARDGASIPERRAYLVVEEQDYANTSLDHLMHEFHGLRQEVLWVLEYAEERGGDRTGQHSIRINDRWRICFVWRDRHAERVEIVDYH